MPYPRAYLWLLLLLPASLLAFWPGYFSDLGNAGLALHMHGLAATAWILLLAGQSWSIHRRMRALHRRVGVASLLLFPVYLAGFGLVFQSEAQRIVDGNPYVDVFGPGIGAITVIAMVATAWLYGQGLRHRRNVQLHARYLLTTPFLFAESVFGRLLNGFLPALSVNSLDDLRHIYESFHWSQAAAIGLALWLWFRDKRHGAPFLFVTVALVLQSVALELFDQIGWWRAVFLFSVEWSTGAIFVIGGLTGIAVAWIGWRSGAGPTARPPATLSSAAHSEHP